VQRLKKARIPPRPRCLPFLSQKINRRTNWYAYCLRRNMPARIKPETPAPPVQPSDRGVDLQRFWIADGPVYRGPFNAVEPFLNWVKAIEVFLDKDKIRIAGGLIQETNSLSFYTSDSSVHLNSMWKDFKASFMTFTLPALCTRARNLCTLINFERDLVSAFDLAEAVTFGLLQDLKTK
ncbi:hypothetical protein VP01_2950g1, partial [Puccinia sorghi]